MTLKRAYGVCALSVVPVRMEPSNKSEVGTQLLFGDLLIIHQVSDDVKWALVEVVSDGYKGWVDVLQIIQVGEEYFIEYQKLKWPVCKELIGLVQGMGKFFPIVMGSTLPFYNDGTVIIGKDIYRFQGEVLFVQSNPNYRFLESVAKYYIGAPYMWGGKSHFGIDCSGFTQQVLKMTGFDVPRDAYLQAECGESVDYSNRMPGDLVFFHNAHGKVIHVGILLEENRIIHASGEVRIDVLNETGILNTSKNLYSHKLHSIKRILG